MYHGTCTSEILENFSRSLYITRMDNDFIHSFKNMFLCLLELFRSLHHHRRWSWSLVFFSAMTELSWMSWILATAEGNAALNLMQMNRSLFRWNLSFLRGRWHHRLMLITPVFILVKFGSFVYNLWSFVFLKFYMSCVRSTKMCETANWKVS